MKCVYVIYSYYPLQGITWIFGVWEDKEEAWNEVNRLEQEKLTSHFIDVQEFVFHSSTEPE